MAGKSWAGIKPGGVGDSVFISSVLSEKYGLKPGDTITIVTRTALILSPLLQLLSISSTRAW